MITDVFLYFDLITQKEKDIIIQTLDPYKPKSLSEAEIEDLGLTLLMKQADRAKIVSRESAMKKLAGK